MKTSAGLKWKDAIGSDVTDNVQFDTHAAIITSKSQLQHTVRAHTQAFTHTFRTGACGRRLMTHQQLTLLET